MRDIILKSIDRCMAGLDKLTSTSTPDETRKKSGRAKSKSM